MADDNDLDLDDGFDDGLDLPDFDSDMFDPGAGESRKPIERIKGGFLQGLGSAATNQANQRRLIDSALPTGYGKAFEDVNTGLMNARSLYDTARRELKPAEKQTKKMARQYIEPASKYLPKRVADRIKDWAKEDDSIGTMSQQELQNVEIDARLTDIFGAQQEADAEVRAEEKADDYAREVRESKRHIEEIDHLSVIRSGIDRQVAYQDRITANYQRESLKMQYRQFFVSRDHYSMMQAYVKDSITEMKSIRHNTSLPEIVKTRSTEAARAMLRTRVLSGLGNSLQEHTRSISDTFRSNLEERLRGFTRQVAEGIQQSGDLAEQTQDIPIDKLELGAGVAGDLVGTEAVVPLGNRLGRLLGKNQTIRRVGENLEYYSDNKTDLFRDKLEQLANRGNTTTGDEVELDGDGLPLTPVQRLAGFRKKLGSGFTELTNQATSAGARMALGMLPTYTPDASYGEANPATLSQEVTAFTELTDLSITKVIPGLLSEILRETEMIRTGSTDVDRRVFDFEKGGISRQTDIASRLRADIFPEERMNEFRASLIETIDQIDDQGALSTEAKTAFLRQMSMDAISSKGFNPERYLKEDGFSAVNDRRLRNELQAFVKDKFFDEDAQGNRTFKADENVARVRNQAAAQVGSARSNLPDYKVRLGELRNLYGAETLRNTGLLNTNVGERDSFNLGSYLDQLVSGERPERSFYRDRPDDARMATRETLSPDRMVLDTSPLPIDGDGLERVVEMVSQQTEVMRSFDLGVQFQYVIDAVRSIDPAEDIAVTNEWLNKIYQQLLDCCDPPPSGPGGGGGPKPRSPDDFTKVGNTGTRWDFVYNGPTAGDVWGDLSQRAGGLRQRAQPYLSQVSDRTQGAYRSLRDRVGSREDVSQAVQSAWSDRDATMRQWSDTMQNQATALKDKALGYRDQYQPQWDDYKATAGQQADRLTGWAQEQRQRVSATAPQMTELKETIHNAIDDKVRDLNDYRMQAQTGYQGSRFQQAVGDGVNWASDVGSSARSNWSTIAQSGQTFGNTLKDRITRQAAGNDDPYLDSDPVRRGGGGGGDGFDDGFWSKARELLQTVIDAMDANTESTLDGMDINTAETIEAINALSLVGSEDGPAQKARPGFGSGLKSMAGRALSGIGSAYGAYARGTGKLVGGVLGGIGGIGKNLLGRLGARKPTAKIEEAEDVYLMGDDRPVLRGIGLRRGWYFDQETQEPITSIDDIEGPVVDRKGDVLISQDDIDEDRLETRQGQSLAGKLLGAGKKYMSLATSPYRWAGRTLMNVAKGIFTQDKGPKDVYVKGETTPRLLAIVMRNGGYFSKATGNVINSVDDIDGDVVDHQGNVVLTLADMQKGLVNKQGSALKTSIGFAGDVAGMIGKGIGAYYRTVWNVAKGAGRKLGGLFNRSGDDSGARDGESVNGVDLSGILAEQQKQTALLEATRTLLANRLPKSIKGDLTGDGFRDNSWQEQLYGKKATNDAEADGKKDKDSEYADPSKNFASMLSGMFGGLFGGGDGDGFGADDALLAGEVYDRARGGDEGKERRRQKRQAKPKGRFGRMFQGIKNLGGKALGLGGRALGLGAGAATAASAAKSGGLMSRMFGGLKTGARYLGGKAGTLARVAAPVAATAATSGLSMAGTALAGAGTAIAGAVSAPVVLGAAAVAAVGLGGFLLWRKFRKPKGSIHSLRVMQYGLDPGEKDHLALIGGLEDALNGSVQIRDREATLSGSSVDMQELAAQFGIDPSNDPEGYQRFGVWFTQRFRPVFLTHHLMASKVGHTGDLMDLDDDLEASQKVNYLKGVNLGGDSSGSPYYVMASPLPGGDTLIDPSDVQDAYDRLVKKAEKEAKKEAKDKKGGFFSRLFGRGDDDDDKPETEATGTTPQERQERIGSTATVTSITAASAATMSANNAPGAVRTTAPTTQTDEPETVEGEVVSADQVVTDAGRRVEDMRRRQERQSQQMSAQSVRAAMDTARDMAKVVNVLSSSLEVQQRMDSTLGEINEYFKHLRQKEEDTEREQRTNRSAAQASMVRNQPSTPKTASQPVVTMSR